MSDSTTALLRPDADTIIPNLLLHFLNSSLFSEQVRDKCRGLTTPHIRVQDAPRFLLPLPPVEVQRKLVAHVGQMQALLHDLKEIREKADLEALLPSLVDRAFNGEL